MSLWPTMLRIGGKELKLLVTSPEGDDLLKARLPVRPPHPRALLTLLEGVALWSGEPVLHVTSCRFTDRTDPVTEVKVYSNAPEVTLEVNGRPLGARKDPSGDRIFRWPGVALSPGENRVSVKAHFGEAEMTDSCIWTLRQR